MWYLGRTGTRLTLYGMYEGVPDLFAGLKIPAQMNVQNMIEHILQECGELYPYHQHGEKLKRNIALWSERHLQDWQRMYDALYSEYDPIENYNRHEWWKDHDQNSGNDVLTNSGTDTTSNSGSDVNTLSGKDIDTKVLDGHKVTTDTPDLTDTNTVAAFDSDTYQPRDRHTQTGSTTEDAKQDDTITDTFDYGKVDTLKHGKVETLDHGHVEDTKYGHILDEEHWGHMHGNIGVTTTQQMVTQELEMRLLYNMYNIITYAFEAEFLVQVY